MWSLTRDARRLGLLVICVLAALLFAAPAFAWNTDPARWMDGTGTGVGVGIDEATSAQFDTTVPHSFLLVCDVAAPSGSPNRLTASWKDLAGNTSTFTLTSLLNSTCSYQTAPAIFCNPIIVDCFDTIVGTGIGSLVSRTPGGSINPLLPNCASCGQIDFRFTDNGPAKTGNALQTMPFDNGEFAVSDLNVGFGILFACMDCPLAKADYHAHQRGTPFSDPQAPPPSTCAVPLGVADSFADLAGSGITNTGPTTIDGDLGSYPTPSVTGTATLTITQMNHGGDIVTRAAKTDLATAYDTAAGMHATFPIVADIGGRTLRPGIYNSGSSIGLTGTLTLDGGGDPNATFVFQAGSTLITASTSRVNLINGAQSCNVFWKVGSSATLGTGSTFRGTILALTSITVTKGVTVEGRVLARNGALTLDSNRITKPSCHR